MPADLFAIIFVYCAPSFQILQHIYNISLNKIINIVYLWKCTCLSKIFDFHKIAYIFCLSPDIDHNIVYI